MRTKKTKAQATEVAERLSAATGWSPHTLENFGWHGSARAELIPGRPMFSMHESHRGRYFLGGLSVYVSGTYGNTPAEALDKLRANAQRIRDEADALLEALG